jgi:hypothetical protein
MVCAGVVLARRFERKHDVSEQQANIKVYLTSTSDTGFSDYVELPAGATIGDLWAAHMAGKDPSQFVIRVARAPGETLPRDFALQDEDRVTITPHKFQGAR